MRQAWGRVYLVGGGPGDPGLITVRGREVLERADVVIHDYLANEALLAYAPRAERVFVGKRSGGHLLPQDEINRILVEQAGRHACVVRLKGGDPFVFGRGGEEALVLAAKGIPFEVIPGVTAGIGASAYAGIPVTHRHVAGSVTFVTGHSGTGCEGSPDLSQLAIEGTLVIYMGVKRLPHTVSQLIELGRAATTPVAVIEWGTYARQRTVVATLATIHEECRRKQIEAPAILIVGEVVALREQLNWFEARPLYGRRIALPTTVNGPSRVAERLRELGADVLQLPVVEVLPAVDEEKLLDVCGVDWIIFTSRNAVQSVFDWLDEQQRDARSLVNARLCVVGAATADALRQRGLRPDASLLTAEPDAVYAALNAVGDISGNRILIPRSDLARSELTHTLRKAMAEVVEWAAYQTFLPDAASATGEECELFRPELIALTNSAAIRNLSRALGPERLDRLQREMGAAVMGPITARTAREHGWRVVAEPERHDVPSLIEAIVQYAANA